VLLDERAVVGPSLEEQVRDAVGDREIGLRAEEEVVVGERRRARTARADVDERHALAARAAIDDAREEDGVHLGRVVAPGDQSTSQ
jgi:hypothetical protein